MWYITILALFKMSHSTSAEPSQSMPSVQETNMVHLIHSTNCASLCIDSNIEPAQNFFTQHLISAAVKISIDEYCPLTFNCLKLTTRFKSPNKLQDSSLPKVFLKLEQDSPITNITGPIQNQVFRVTQDILVIVCIDYKNNPTRHKFDGHFPNMLPKTAILLVGNGVSLFQPYQSRAFNNHLHTTWKELSSVQELRAIVNIKNKITLKKNFERLPIILKKIQLPKNKKFVCKSSKPRDVSPWTINIGLLLICDFIDQFNISLQVNTTYPYPSYTYTVLSKQFPASRLFLTINNLDIAFSVPVDRDGINLQGILGPIGPDVLAWTGGSAIFVTIFIYISVRMVGNKLGQGNLPKKISVSSAMEFVIRPILEQCQDRKGNAHDYFRVGMLPWLLFSIIIAEGYRGELVSFMIQPPSAWVPGTFR